MRGPAESYSDVILRLAESLKVLSRFRQPSNPRPERGTRGMASPPGAQPYEVAKHKHGTTFLVIRFL